MISHQIEKKGKDFISLTKEECATVYQDMLKNSDSNWQSADKLAVAGDYGRAISLSIISIEELVKALLIYFDGKGFKLRKMNGIRVLFKSHQIRYLIAYGMFVMALFGEELHKLLLQFHNNPSVLNSWMEVMQDEKRLDRKMKHYAFRKIILLRRELDWFSRVDLFRQEGFYCDYIDRLKNPITISPEDFLYARERLAKVRKFGKELIAAYNEDSDIMQEHVMKMKTDFETKGHYGKIEAALKFLKDARMLPFEFVKSKIDFLANPS